MKSKLSFFLLVFAAFFVLHIHLISAELCQGYQGYYHDCGCVYQKQGSVHPYEYGRYESSRYHYPPVYYPSYQKTMPQYPLDYGDDRYYSYASGYAFHRSLYMYEPAYDIPTYYMHRNSYR